MAGTIYAHSAVPPNVTTLVHTVGANSILSIRILNKSQSQIRVSISIGGTLVPLPEDYIEYEAVVDPSCILENTDIAVSTGHYISVKSTTPGCNVMVYGIT